jgi:ribosome-binding factor A
MSRIDRINSLLREVISDVIKNEVKNPHVSVMVGVTLVETARDLHHAKVYVSIIGDKAEKEKTMKALHQSAGFIAQAASKEVRLPYFPNLHFILDEGVDKHERIEELLQKIEKEKNPDGV